MMQMFHSPVDAPNADRTSFLRVIGSISKLGTALAACALIFGALPAQAGVGIAVVLDLPKQAKTGSNAGVLTIANVNTDAHLAATNLVFDITVTPSCGA